jgi:hypothetical protein
MVAYLVASASTYRLGFPLDDSWIHATYARNFALYGEWAFQLGRPSAGSTAPLWTMLLMPGYWLRIGPLWWSHVLGLASLLGLGVAAEVMARRELEEYRPRLPWIGMLIAAEWHMLWAAVSGMETVLYTVLATTVLAALVAGTRSYAALGLLTGLSVWVRPDGLTLIGPALVVILLGRARRESQMRAIASYMLGCGSLLVPYLVFNLALAGTPMPNTFYAKQAEYAAWQARPLLSRLGIGFAQLSVGPMILVWPGLLMTAVRSVRRRDIAVGAALVWCAAYALVYLWRLPAYQHGRYLMPVMPVLLILGVLGLARYASESKGRPRRWALSWAWPLATGLLGLGFIVLGARSYAEDVAVIETEMVDTAVWVAGHVPAGDAVAAHDIGALGYFDNHTLIDLAGLVSPEVVPFIRDEARLAALLDARKVRYLVAFPDLYPELAGSSRIVHTSNGKFAPSAGQDNMTVYCWRCP